MLLGPPCGLFVFISSSYHRRSAGMPYGDQSKPRICAANQLVINLVILLCVAHTRKIFFLNLVSISLKHVFAICAQDRAASILITVGLSRDGSLPLHPRRSSNIYVDESFWARLAETNNPLWEP